MICILSALALAGPAALSPIQGQRTVSEREMMHMWGQSIAKTMPASVKKAGRLKQLQFAFRRYCDALDKRGVTNNDSYAKRAYNLFKEGSRTKWTCGDHSELLDSLFSGMGISSKDLVYVKADSESLLPSANSDHGALGVIIDGKLYVFDAWQVARPNGSFNLDKNIQGPIWNGGEALKWELQMLAQGYKSFAINAGAGFKHVADALSAYRQSLLPQKPAPPPKTAVWVLDGDPELYIDEPRKDCTIAWEKGHLMSHGKWGYPERPGVSPIDFHVRYNLTLPEWLNAGETGVCEVELIYNYVQQNVQSRGYTMSVEVHVGQFTPTGDWKNNRGATNFLKVVAACNDESPNKGGVLHPVKDKASFTAPKVTPTPGVTRRFAIQFYIYGPGTPTARVVQVYKTR